MVKSTIFLLVMVLLFRFVHFIGLSSLKNDDCRNNVACYFSGLGDCRYKDHRDIEGNRTMYYFMLVCARLAFVICFEVSEFEVWTYVSLEPCCRGSGKFSTALKARSVNV